MAAEFPQLPPQGGAPRTVATIVNLAMRGKLNALTLLKLAPNATTSALQDRRIGPDSFIALMPLTANAAGALATTFVSARANGAATITHANAAGTDRDFGVLIIG